MNELLEMGKRVAEEIIRDIKDIRVVEPHKIRMVSQEWIEEREEEYLVKEKK